MVADFAVEWRAEFFSGAPFMFLWKSLAQGPLSVSFSGLMWYICGNVDL